MKKKILVFLCSFSCKLESGLISRCCQTRNQNWTSFRLLIFWQSTNSLKQRVTVLHPLDVIRWWKMMTPTGKPVCKLLDNLQTNFNQTWHKTFIGKKIKFVHSRCKGDMKPKYQNYDLKIVITRTLAWAINMQFQLNFAQKISGCNLIKSTTVPLLKAKWLSKWILSGYFKT